jgi:hypothetical protein
VSGRGPLYRLAHRADRSQPPKADSPSVDQASAAGTHSPPEAQAPPRGGSVNEEPPIPVYPREIPLTVADRTVFIQRRASAYAIGLARNRDVPFPAPLWKIFGRRWSLPSERRIAQELAVEDLYALIGRGGKDSHFVQLVTEDLERLRRKPRAPG